MSRSLNLVLMINQLSETSVERQGTFDLHMKGFHIPSWMIPFWWMERFLPMKDFDTVEEMDEWGR